MSVTLKDVRNEHPWGQRHAPGVWETRYYQAETHIEAGREAQRKVLQGWSVWLVSNTGTPGFVIYRKTND